MARDRPPLKPSGRDGGTDQSAPNAPKDAQAGREAPCNQRRKAKRQSAQAGRRVRRGRDRRRTLRGVQNGDTTASRSDPKGAELTLCPAPRGAQGSAGGTQRSRAPVRAAFGRGSGGAHAANTEPLCSQRRKKISGERTSRTARPTRRRPTTHAAGAQNGDTTASRSDPKGAELTLCPAPRGAQGSAGGTQR